MKRIAIAGKGGSGKTTISGTMARLWARRLDDGLLAVDGDPNPNLATVIGISRDQPWPLLPHELLHREVPAGAKTRLAEPLDVILDRYGVDGPDGVKLIALGEVERAGKG